MKLSVGVAGLTHNHTWMHLQGMALIDEVEAVHVFEEDAELLARAKTYPKVVATYKNNVRVFHDVDIIPYTTPLPSRSVAPAFPGARSPLPRFRPGTGGRPGAGGPPSAGKPQTFSFVASKAGRYMMICGIAGHALAGMWDTFVVSRTARVASVTFE